MQYPDKLTIIVPQFLMVIDQNKRAFSERCGSACKRDPVSGVIGVQKGPLILMV